MVVYEVTSRLLTESIEKEWLEWMLDEHIEQVVKTGCFTSADLFKDTENSLRYTVRYESRDMEDLHRYMLEFAPKLRAEFIKRFDGYVEIKRTIWEHQSKIST